MVALSKARPCDRVASVSRLRFGIVIARRQVVAALLVPFGVVASHTISYLLAHPGAGDRARALGSVHGHLAPLALVGAASVIVAALAAGDAGYRGLRLRVTAGQMAAGQVVAFAGMELGERLVDGAGVSAALREPAVWIGLVVQLAVAFVARVLVRVSERAGASLAARRARRWRRAPAVVWPASAVGVVPVAPVTSLSRRGPPVLLVS